LTEPYRPGIENCCEFGDIGHMERSLEQMARSLVESGHYRATSRLEPQAEYHPANDFPKLIAAVVDVETTGTNPDRDKIIEFGVCLFEYDRQTGQIYKVLGPGSGSKIPEVQSRPRSRPLPASPIRWSPVTVLTIARSTIF
jgi:DNA polymerase III epsilon subunit-like protein